MKHLPVIAFLVSFGACGGSGTSTPTTPTPTPTPTTFSLSGQVTESGTSTAIGGAKVSIADGPNAGRSTTTDSSGNYSLTGLQQSGFTVNVSADNYQPQSKGMTLTSNQTLSFQLVRAGPRTTFGTGQYLVGTDIAAGRYFSDP